jgi:CBS domain-containing protein
MQVGEIMKTDVKSAAPEATFAEVARLLHDSHISSVIVMEGDTLAGIVTERDVVNVVSEGVDPRQVRVRDRMTRDLDTVESKTDIAEAAEHMARRQIRHLPIVDRGKVAGIISIRDLTNWAVEELAGGHEMPDLQRTNTTLSAAARINRTNAGQ